MSNNDIAMPIAAVERDTGLSKDVLRVWERRYGFPQPDRGGNGERLYPMDQVHRLHEIKRLLDRGYRPNKVVPLPLEELEALAGQHARPGDHGRAAELIAALRADEPDAVGALLRRRLASEGLRGFVIDTLADANQAVGEAWRRGEIAVHEEHLYSEQVQIVLRAALNTMPQGNGRPRILLATLPGELHTLGLLMVESLMRISGAEVLPYGAQMPLSEVAAAARKHQVDIVALSFSAGFPVGTATEMLEALRGQLPDNVTLWAGGRGFPERARQHAQVLAPGLEGLDQALDKWRTDRPD